MEKEPCKKFCSVLIRFHEAKKLQSFEFNVSDVIPANLQNMLTQASFAFFVSFVEKNFL